MEIKGKKRKHLCSFLFFSCVFFCIFRAFSVSRHCIYVPLVCLYDVSARVCACKCLSLPRCVCDVRVHVSFPVPSQRMPKKYQIRPFKTNTTHIHTHTRMLWKCVRYEFEYSWWTLTKTAATMLCASFLCKIFTSLNLHFILHKYVCCPLFRIYLLIICHTFANTFAVCLFFPHHLLVWAACHPSPTFTLSFNVVLVIVVFDLTPYLSRKKRNIYMRISACTVYSLLCIAAAAADGACGCSFSV